VKFYVRGVEIKKGAFKNPSKFFFSQEREFFCRNRDRRARDRQESRARRLLFYSQRSPQEEASGYLPATTFA